VVGLSTDNERRRAHEKLAALLTDQPDRQARHFAEATPVPDEHVAGLLEQAAQRILARRRHRRLATAAYLGATAPRELEVVSQLLDDARRAEPGGSLEAAIAASYLLLSGGRR
jgi:hypothetical protein